VVGENLGIDSRACAVQGGGGGTLGSVDGGQEDYMH
jgi:hypothetical protein